VIHQLYIFLITLFCIVNITGITTFTLYIVDKHYEHVITLKLLLLASWKWECDI